MSTLSTIAFVLGLGLLGGFAWLGAMAVVVMYLIKEESKAPPKG